MLLATWWVRPPSMTVGNPTTAAKEHFHLSHSLLHSFLGHCFRHQCTSNPITSNVFRWTCHHLRSAFRTTMRIKGNFLLLCFHVDNLRVHVETSWSVTPEELSCVLKPFVTSRSRLVYDEAAKVSESKLHKGNALKHVATLDSPPRALTKSRVHTVCCDNGFQATGRPIRDVKGRIEGMGGNHDESAAEPLQDSEPKLAKESQLRVCFRHSRGARQRQTPLRNLVTLWSTIENSVWVGVVCRTGQDQQRCRARSLRPRERNQPTH